jgi:LacI family transcriptional regulator
MTVSRVINGRQNVSAATREKVNAAIEALGYVPNPAARSLAGGERLKIGVLCSNPSASYLSEFLMGGLTAATQGDVHLAVERYEEGADAEAIVRRLAGGVHGVILPPPVCESRVVIETLAAMNVPSVSVAGGLSRPGAWTIGIDDYAAARAMTKHLVTLGHRRIGFILGDAALSASEARHRGYVDALAEAGIEVDPALVVEGDYTYRSGLDAAEELLNLAELPTAIFSSNDDMAAAVIGIAHGKAIDIPGDLSVCGFDDTGLATAVWPELTTIRQPVADMAMAAVTLLADRLRGNIAGSRPVHRFVDFTLIRRHSDAPPRRTARARAGSR